MNGQKYDPLALSILLERLRNPPDDFEKVHKEMRKVLGK